MPRCSAPVAMTLLAGALAAAACARAPEPDAYGNVEADDVIVGAESAGRIVAFDVTEGQALAAAAVVGSIDPTELGIEREQLEAQRAATASRANEIGRQIEVLEAQRAATTAQRNAAAAQLGSLAAQQEIAHRTHERTERLFDQQAATSQQLDQAERDDRVLGEQIKAQNEEISAAEQQIGAVTRQIEAARAELQSVRHQVASADAQVARVGERIRKSDIRNPVKGTVLATYAKAGEVVQPGQPLYRIANLDSVDVRAYVGETELANIRLGQAAQVTVDAGADQRKTLAGTISWISSQAEFTPTPIQTRDERADLVYAVKIRVPNEGHILKIGMPADVRFGAASGAQQ